MDQRVLQIGFRILVLQVEELEDEWVLQRLLGSDGITRNGHFSLLQHRRLVAGQGDALVELAVDLTIQLTHAPTASQGLHLVEGTRSFRLHRQQADLR
jgi:flagellar basal body rod protein FlgG